MALPYENTSSGEKATSELQKILSKFGCDRFGVMVDNGTGELIVQFAYRKRDVVVKASFKGYAAAWLREHPYSSRSRTSKIDYERKGLDVGRIAVYSIVRDWIKGQIVAIETGIIPFEAAFLGQIMLPSGQTVMEHVAGKVLPALEAPKP